MPGKPISSRSIYARIRLSRNYKKLHCFPRGYIKWATLFIIALFNCLLIDIFKKKITNRFRWLSQHHVMNWKHFSWHSRSVYVGAIFISVSLYQKYNPFLLWNSCPEVEQMTDNTWASHLHGSGTISVPAGERFIPRDKNYLSSSACMHRAEGHRWFIFCCQSICDQWTQMGKY